MKNNYEAFFDVPGEMAQLIRDYDWTTTEIGHPSTWPNALLNTLGVVLRTNFPMVIWWGDHHIQFYNDAYRENIDDGFRHPKALGQKAEECWVEIWPILNARLIAVQHNADPPFIKDRKMALYRNGEIQDIFATYSFGKIIDPEGSIGGVLMVCLETTNHVNTVKKKDEALNEIAEDEKRLRYLLNDAPVPIAVLKGEELLIDTANSEMLAVWNRTLDSVLGFPIDEAFPELNRQGFVKLLREVFATGEPYHANEQLVFFENENGELKEEYGTFVFQPIANGFGKTEYIMIVATVVTEQVLTRKKVEQAEEMLRLSIEAANVATFNVNLENHSMIASDRLRELFDFGDDKEVNFDDLMGKVSQAYAAKAKETLDKAIETGNDYKSEFPIVLNGSREERWIKALGRIYRDETQNSKQFSGIMLDITEQKNDDRRKNDFIGMVSHELKTPITSLSAYLQLLHLKLKNSDDRALEGFLGKANHQVKKMSSLITGFLDVSRLESGKIVLDKNTFNLITLVDEVLDEVVLTSPGRHIIKDAPSEVMVHADYDKITSVLSNLCGNALKYSPPTSGVKISVTRNDKEVVVSVNDKGVGIAEPDLDKLFDRYYRSESNILKHISGFGIGLYLSAEIVEIHQGKIWVESQFGQGSTFYFSLPL